MSPALNAAEDEGHGPVYRRTPGIFALYLLVVLTGKFLFANLFLAVLAQVTEMAVLRSLRAASTLACASALERALKASAFALERALKTRQDIDQEEVCLRTCAGVLAGESRQQTRGGASARAAPAADAFGARQLHYCEPSAARFAFRKSQPASVQEASAVQRSETPTWESGLCLSAVLRVRSSRVQNVKIYCCAGAERAHEECN